MTITPIPAVKRSSRWTVPSISYLIVIALSVGVTSTLISISGHSPLEVWGVIIAGGFGDLVRFGLSLNLAAVFLFSSLGLIFAFKSGLWNIGSEGQIFMGALGTVLVGIFITGIPKPLHLILVFLAGFVFGGIWGAVPGILKVKYKANEIITTLMMNFIAIWFITYLVDGPLQDPLAYLPASEKIVTSARLPIILPETAAHAGILLAIVLTIVVWLVLRNTVFGYRIKAMGVNPDAAAYGGISVGKLNIIAMTLSGGLAGLAGMGQVSGALHLLADYVSYGYGFLAIAVAFVARLNPIAVVLVSILLGGLLRGGRFAEITVGVDMSVIQTLAPLLMLFLILVPSIEKRVSRIL